MMAEFNIGASFGSLIILFALRGAITVSYESSASNKSTSPIKSGRFLLIAP
jgi:hypothetical protein